MLKKWRNVDIKHVHSTPISPTGLIVKRGLGGFVYPGLQPGLVYAALSGLKAKRMHSAIFRSRMPANEGIMDPGAVCYRWAESEGVFVPASSGLNPSMLLMVVGVVFVLRLFYYLKLFVISFFVNFVVKNVIRVAANGYVISLLCITFR